MIVKFLGNAFLSSLGFGEKGRDQILFRFGAQKQHAIRIARNAETSDASDNKDKRLVATVVIAIDVSNDAHKFIEGVLNRKYFHYGPNAPSLPYSHNGSERVASDGSIVHERLPFGAYPKEIQEIVVRARLDIEQHLHRFIGLLCWQQRLDLDPTAYDHMVLYWGLDTKFTRVGERQESAFFPRHSNFMWDDAVASNLAELWTEGASQPLAHELVHEAISAANTAPHSSILMAVAALETGVKAHIATISPDRAWLMAQPQTPPVFLLLDHYMVKLHASNGVDMAFWKEFSGALADARSLIEFRNILAHKGRYPVLKKPLRRYIQSVSDLLYALNVLEGHEWAKDRVHFSLKVKLRWGDWNKTHVEFGDFVTTESA